MIEPLGPHRDRMAFSCGEPALDSYLQRQASQDARRRVAQVFVAADDTPGKIAGYYSLSAASFEKDELPPAFAKRLPHYPVPVAVLGRLAIDRAQLGRGLGETLLLDAIRRVLRASTTIAVYAIIVDAKNERARGRKEGRKGEKKGEKGEKGKGDATLYILSRPFIESICRVVAKATA